MLANITYSNHLHVSALEVARELVLGFNLLDIVLIVLSMGAAIAVILGFLFVFMVHAVAGELLIGCRHDYEQEGSRKQKLWRKWRKQEWRRGV